MNWIAQTVNYKFYVACPLGDSGKAGFAGCGHIMHEGLTEATPYKESSFQIQNSCQQKLAGQRTENILTPVLCISTSFRATE